MPFERQPRTDAPRRDVIGGSVSTAERAEITEAFEQAGFQSMSDAVRTVALAFVGSTRVRDAVAAWRRQNDGQ